MTIIAFSVDKGLLSDVFKCRLFSWLDNMPMCVYMVHGLIIHYVPKISLLYWILILLTFVLVLSISHFLSKYYVPYTSLVILKLSTRNNK